MGLTRLRAVVPLLTIAACGGSALILSAAQSPGNADDPYPFRAADSGASPRIARLLVDIRENREPAVEEFWDEMRKNGTPIVEPMAGDDRHSHVTFVWRGSAGATNVVITDGVSIGVGGADPVNSKMERIPGTDVWYRTYDVRKDGRFTYSLSENDPLTRFNAPNRKSNSKPDPLNPRRFLTGQTYLELPDAPAQPSIVPRPPEESGQVEAAGFTGRAAWVYTPRGFHTTGERYPLLVALGGGQFVNLVPVPLILDNLIAERRIPPVVAAIVGYAEGEAYCSPAFASFLADDIVPWMREHHHATDQPGRTVIGGASLGGLASAFTAVTRPDVFGNVLSQSGSYWWAPPKAPAEWLTREISGMPRRPVRFFLEIGHMEVADEMLRPNRRLRDVLKAKGYAVHYQEFNGNHNYLNWRGSFADGLIALLGR